ncbi:MAG: hypothetical protein E7231_11880 [Cellulosilyticum sp.]|nr:hypothetical protein [Cellulosilyticum sp.]
MCEECYSDEARVTPLLEPEKCLRNHTQYICSTCGRCICIESDKKRGIRRWNFPFKSAEVAKLYLRAAEVSVETCCGIYEIKNERGRKAYKIFESVEALNIYLAKNKDKKCETMQPIYESEQYRQVKSAQVRKLTDLEVRNYLKEQLGDKNNLL